MPLNRLTLCVVMLLGSAVMQPAGAEPVSTTRSVRHIQYVEWTSAADWQAGARDGTVIRRGSIRIGKPAGTVRYRDPYGHGPRRSYDFARWLSPWARSGFGLDQLIASWNAGTPHGTWISVEARGRDHAGVTSSWDLLGRWASHDRNFHRTSLGSQRDDLARVAVDTLLTRQASRFGRWQLRLTLLRRTGSSVSPRVRSIGAMVSRLPDVTSVPRSTPGRARGDSLRVPRFSQMIHRGEYPQWDNGGEAWCSPTSTTMVLKYWHRGPSAGQLDWVDSSYAQPAVDFAARSVYDYRYDGTGNWPFNAAYAARFHLDSFVTRLRSLREAERFIAAGIPLVASIAFGAGELAGSPISASSGHLLVITGFSHRGNVIVNDPAAGSASGVRRVYRRGQFENAWIPTTGGVVYVIHPAGQPLPRRGAHRNW